MAVANNADGRLEIFAIGRDHALIHVWQTVPNGDWSDWRSLGGSFTRSPAVSRHADGRLTVFAVDGSGVLWQNSQRAPNADWTGWTMRGGEIPTVTPVVGRNADGRLEVFGVRQAEIWHTWQLTPDGDAWSDWRLFGDGFRSPAAGFARIAVGVDATGRLAVFATGRYGRNEMWHRRQAERSNGWADWTPIPGARVHDAPVAARESDGRLVVFAGGVEGIWHTAQRRPDDPSWSDWRLLEGLRETVSVGANVDGRLELFAVVPVTGEVLHRWETAPGSGAWWPVWESLGGTESGWPVTVGRNADGRLEVFARDATAVRPACARHRWQTASSDGWSGWERLGDYEVRELGIAPDWAV